MIRQSADAAALCCTAILGLSFFAYSCARTVAVAPHSSVRLGSPDQVLTLVREQEDGLQSMRTRFDSVFERSGEVRRAKGVLVVKKPERFRLRLVSPFGFTVLDFLSVNDSDRLSLPLEHKVLVDDEIAHDAPFSGADLRPAFLRGAAAFPGLCKASDDAGQVRIDCRDAAGVLLRQLRIDPTNATITEEVGFANGSPRLDTRYSDFRGVDDRLLPFAIELTYPGQNVVLRITVERYEINPVLADDLFAAGP